MNPRSAPRTRVNIPVFPDTETSWMMSGTGSSWMDPWKDMRYVHDSKEGPPERVLPPFGRAGVHVADRHGERVGGVERDACALAREKRQDHGAHLRLFGLAVADERLLHEARLVLEDRETRLRRRRDQHAARMRQLDRRGDVLSGEHGLDGH